ncbi:SipW-dependent-type signal peptide-containing protein [Halobellus sp. H-GB7]|uniref:SipW-dependent-type signal peptide-containing protein n=1 Tax=Halobellus sp. H-GB7 TaxID=3069756 RepID=UPI0027B297CB|nr:SipW-dependent-type signal peptide-containing protein [Halobellus sp. H-GB7]MDQ2053891.1 SipW-dependent-type signal peptide-containing protein [Halobellus sp. H-GB7]
MTEYEFDLSRRKVLGALGAVGAASAGAGLGTTAYFNDTESFEGNTLTAGELDLKVDWQQTYNGPIPDSGGEVGDHPVNAYPDSSGDGIQDLNGVRYSGAGEIDPVFDAADIPACCDCADDEYYVTYGGESYCIEPLGDGSTSIEDFYDYDDTSGVYSSLNDEIQRENTTFVFLYEGSEGLSLVIVNDDRENTEGGSAASFTIEGAPGDTGWLVNDGNGDDNWVVKDDTEGDTDAGFDQYQIAEADWVWTNNRTDGGAIGSLADDFALRLSASLNAAAELYDSPARGSGQIEEFVLLSGGSGPDSGSEEITLEAEIGEAENNEIGPVTIHSACGIESGSQLPEGVFSSAHYPKQDSLIQLGDVKPGDSGEVTFSVHLCDNPAYVWLTAANFTQDGNVLTEPEAVKINESNSDISDVGDVTTEDDLGKLASEMQVTVWYDEDCDNEFEEAETTIFDGTLADMLGTFDGDAATSEGAKHPLDSDTETEGRQCFPAEEGFCVGFDWEIPTSVGNEIQGDSVSFDLGFYTEQCRHNDGSGPEVES